ncbi:PaRep2a protein [Pyrobaculum aerophilum]|uniref:PaREP2a n=1 Tax=Pyrobaculum aerophilum TaxID=13773 RepID=A0A371QZF4_9CREN|nr:PaRep2a protein [Pyrobaculum aerophilum]RFA95663.1 hypothetical protein CGL51_07135 [Pyrobaculum aerophilum]RFA96124.1 hypothetical protein CGL52_11625 [Pyrobaculum aerophilum]
MPISNIKTRDIKNKTKKNKTLCSKYALRGAFWWEGEWMGKPMSCFVTEKKAMCKVGDKIDV